MMLTSHYRVRLPEFEGPLDVLLFFVQREELPVTEIPIARLVDQFLEYVRWIEAVDLDSAADFLVIAAELLGLKTRWILRRPSDTEPEDIEGAAVGAEALWQRMVEYRRYKYAASFLRWRMEQANPPFARWMPLPWERSRALPEGGAMTSAALVEVFRALLQRLGRSVALLPPRLEPSIEECVSQLLAAVGQRTKVPFSALLQKRSPAEVVALFFALLELLRQGRLYAVQEERFGEIFLSADAEPIDRGDDGDRSSTPSGGGSVAVCQ